jgi:hypothetical protein
MKSISVTLTIVPDGGTKKFTINTGDPVESLLQIAPIPERRREICDVWVNGKFIEDPKTTSLKNDDKVVLLPKKVVDGMILTARMERDERLAAKIA